MTTGHLGILPEQPDRRLLRRAAMLGRTAPLWAGGPRILSDAAEIATLLRNGCLTKDYPRSIARERTNESPSLRQLVDSALFLLDPPEHGRFRTALNPLHIDPDRMNTRIEMSVWKTLDSLPLGVPLDARWDVGTPAAVGVVGALFNIAIPAEEGNHLAHAAIALNDLTGIHTDRAPTTQEEQSARALRRATENWLSSPSFVVGSEQGRSQGASAKIPSDRYRDLIQFVAATAIETVATTVVASLASGLPPVQVQRLFTYATTAPLLPYTLKQAPCDDVPVLLNVSHAHPFGIGRHHCLGANIAKHVAQTTCAWSATRSVEVAGELQWQTDKLGRSLHGTITLIARGVGSVREPRCS